MKTNFNAGRVQDSQRSLINFATAVQFRLPQLLLPFLLLAEVAQATDVTFQFEDFTRNTSFFSATNIILEVKPPGVDVDGNLIVLRDWKRYTNSSTGTLVISNMLPAVYTLTITAKNTASGPLLLLVTNFVGTYYAAQHIVSPTNVTPNAGTVAYSIASANATFLKIFSSPTLYVSTNGSDSTGTRGRIDLPFLTATGAVNASSVEDLIWFHPGKYDCGTNGILRLNRHYYFSPRASLTWSNGTMTADAYCLFDDRQTGPTTNYIMGYGRFLASANKSGTDEANFNIRGAFSVTNHTSEIHIQGIRTDVDAPTEGAVQGNVSGLNVADGTVYFEMEEGIFPTPDFDGGFSGNVMMGIYWLLGDVHVKCPKVISRSYYGMWGHDASPGTTAAGFWFEGDEIISTNGVGFYTDGTAGVDSPNYRTWLKVKEIKGGQLGFSTIGQNRVYLNAQKVSSIAGTSVDSAAVVWADIQKISGTNGLMTLRGGEGHFAVHHYEDLSPDGLTGQNKVLLLGGNNELSDGWYRAKSTNSIYFARVVGGTNRLKNMFVDMTKAGTTNAWAVYMDATNANALTVQNSTFLQTGPTTNSIYSTNAQTVINSGVLVSSTNLHPNISLSGGLLVNNGRLYGDGGGLTNIASSFDGTAITNLINTRGTESTNFARGTIGLALTNAISGATNVVLHTNTLRAGNGITLTNAGISRVDIAVTPGMFMTAFQNKIPRFVINSGTGATFTGVGDSATIAAPGTQVAVAGDATGPPGVIMPTFGSTTSASSVSGNLNFRTGKSCESATWAGATNTGTAFTFWHLLTDQAASVVTGTNPNGNYAGFRYNTTGDTTYKFVTKDNSTQTITDTLVALGNSFHTFWFFEDVANSRWIGYIDGVSVATNTTHLPSASTYLRYVVSVTTDTGSTNALRMSWEAGASSNF